MPHPPPTTPQYLTILMTEREGAPLFFIQFWRPPPPHAPTPQTPQYLTILMTDRVRHYVCRILAPTMPPSHDATILNYLNDRERGRHYFL